MTTDFLQTLVRDHQDALLAEARGARLARLSKRWQRARRVPLPPREKARVREPVGVR